MEQARVRDCGVRESDHIILANLLSPHYLSIYIYIYNRITLLYAQKLQNVVN